MHTLLFSFAVHTSKCEEIPVDEGLETRHTISDNDYVKLVFSSAVAGVHHHGIKTKEGFFTLLTIDGYGYSMVEGSPQLPVLKKLIEVPVNAGIRIEVLHASFSEFTLSDFGIDHPVIPVQPSVCKSCDNPEDLEFVYNKSIYANDQFLGGETVDVFELGIMRGVKLARLEISPVQYNPVKNTIRVCSELEVKITFTGADIAATLNNKTAFFSPYFEGINGLIWNYKHLESDELIMDEPATYVIVSDPMFQPALQPFVAWKKKKGFYVIEGYTNDPSVGTTTTSIKAYLQNLYNNPPAGMNPQSFVLFVGDVAQIPAFSGTAGSHVSDLYYCEYTGDIYPECFYGRFSANNLAQLQPQIDKTLEYEQYLMPDPSFLDEVVMVAGADAAHGQVWGNGQINYGTSNYFNLAHGLTSHTYLQPEPAGANYSQQIRQNVSDGVAYANYTAHCGSSGWSDPSFSISHIASLANESKYPLMVGNCCSSLEFQGNCFGEEVLRAANKGALGYIGGSNSTYWDEDFWWGVGFETISANPVYNPQNLGAYDRMFHDNGEPLTEWFVTQGQMFPAGNLAVTQSGTAKETYYWEIYHLMGDPSLMVYFSQPPVTTANYQSLLPIGAYSFTVNTDPYAYVAISKDGTLHGVAIANQNGVADIQFFEPLMVPGTADVVITRQNGKPFIGTLNVASPNGPYVLLEEVIIDDSNGNNNGLVDYGEVILLDITLVNLGNANSGNLTATLSTNDTYVSFNISSHTWPSIAAGASLLQSGAFEFAVAGLIPDMHLVIFDLEVTDGTDIWYSSFNVMLHAPVLEIPGYVIDDVNGNNNGRPDPGETINLEVENLNAGHSATPLATATIASTSNLVTINTTTYNLGSVLPGESKNAVFSISISPDAQTGDIIDIHYILTCLPYSKAATLSLVVGLIVEDFETGDFSAFTWQMGGNAPWVITQTNVYEGAYSAKSGAITHNQVSTLYLTADIVAAGDISFFRKVSSESGYDFLVFSIDGNVMEQWSGEVPWGEVSFPVSAGQQTFEWKYSKDVSLSTGNDCAWLDYIIFPGFASGPAPLTVNASGSPADICSGGSSQLFAFVSGGSGNYTFQWSPQAGLNDPNIQNPVASPASTTTYMVTVSDGNSTVSDDVTVTVLPVPETPVITQQGSSLVSSSQTGNQWYNSAGPVPGAVSQVYYPTVTENYYVIVTNQHNCSSGPSNAIYFIFTGISELQNGDMVHIYPVPFAGHFFIDYMLKGNSSVRISLYNSFGKEIEVVTDVSKQKAGFHRVSVFSDTFRKGVYFCRIHTDEYTVMKRLIHY